MEHETTSVAGKVKIKGKDWREERRLRVLELYRKQWPQKQIAEALGITEGYVSQLVKRIREACETDPTQVLQARLRPGRKPRLSEEQKRAMTSLVDQGARSYGLPGDAWTLHTLCEVIKKELGVVVCKSWLSQILRSRGYSCQKPETHARERNDRAVSGFRGGWWSLKRGL
jgi:transposase